MLTKIIATIIILFQSFIGFIINNNSNSLTTSNSTNQKQEIEPSYYQLPKTEDLPFLNSEINPILPLRRWDIPNIEIQAFSALILDIESEKILYQKNIEEKIPIASLTKLMTALIILETTDLDKIVTVSKKAVETYGKMGKLRVGEKISVKNLLYALLIESSNDAAVSLAENYGNEFSQNDRLDEFVDLMNKKALELGLKNTHFVDPSGLNPDNISTAWDLSQLTKFILNKPLIWEILQIPAIDVYSADGLYNHHLVNSNKLLGHLSGVVGGKTGYTEEAKECMILVIKEKDSNIIFVLLKSPDRFKEMKELVNWVSKAYIY